MSRENLQEILSALVPFAKTQLEEIGTCPPVAASMSGAGEIDLHMPPVGEGGPAEQFIELLTMALRNGASRGEFTATGLCMEVRAQRADEAEAHDAICVHLEAQGESLQFFLPFEMDGNGDVAYGETFFGPADPEIYRDNGHEIQAQ